MPWIRFATIAAVAGLKTKQSFRIHFLRRILQQDSSLKLINCLRTQHQIGSNARMFSQAYQGITRVDNRVKAVVLDFL